MNILLHYYHKTVPEPKEVNVSTNQYRVTNDVVMQFVNSKCLFDKNNKTYRCFCVELWNAYQEWIISDGMLNNIKQTEFYKRIDRLTSHDRNNKVKIEDKKSTGWYGICLKNDEDDRS